MEAVTRFKTFDGELFETDAEAQEHEAYLMKVKDVENMLHPLPQNDGCSFANGDGYIQHTKEAFNAYKAAILELGGKHVHSAMTEWAKNPDEVHNMGIAGRYFDDGDHGLYKLWNRVMCTDADFREWGQPFFALNPGKGKMVKVA